MFYAVTFLWNRAGANYQPTIRMGEDQHLEPLYYFGLTPEIAAGIAKHDALDHPAMDTDHLPDKIVLASRKNPDDKLIFDYHEVASIPMVEISSQDLPPIIGLTGRKYSGKTEVAKYLCRFGYVGLPITDTMVDMAIPLLRAMNVPEDEIEERLSPTGKMKDDPIPNFPWLTGRKILQSIGKELRDALSEPLGEGQPPINANGTDSLLFFNLWLHYHPEDIPLVNQSVRYPHERDMIRANGGEVWRIVNPEAPEPTDEHESERQDWEVDRTLILPHSKGIKFMHEVVLNVLLKNIR